ncbi:hypothetical protein [Sulfuriflexus mobilis]|uniref:hypothetical protein n=1 Tax=Sulfuriflexus mobilis TaxID=1811807 RepID=UPI000F825DD8|nr:hypothetical protein [Sulfuriflexus mobilis]
MKNQSKLSVIFACALLLTGTTVSAAQQGGGSDRAGQGPERVEMEMEKRTRQESPDDDASKTRESMRTTEEMQKEAGKGSDMAEPERETSRKWWEFWK